MVNSLSKNLVLIIIVAAFIFLLYWLWQRQPKPLETNSEIDSTQEAKSKEQIAESLSIESPKNNTVVKDVKVTITGKTAPNAFIALFSPADEGVTKSDANGKFEKEITLSEGLNFVSISNPQEKSGKIITIWYSKTEKAPNIVAGVVKSTFDKLITASTLDGEHRINTTKDTAFDFPKNEEAEASSSAVKDVRIGDYVIALGNNKNDLINTDELQVIRDNKPRIVKEIANVKVVTNFKTSTFSAKSTTDDKILEFVVDRNTTIQQEGKEAKNLDITKDKAAIVIFHKDVDKKIADLVFLLP